MINITLHWYSIQCINVRIYVINISYSLHIREITTNMFPYTKKSYSWVLFTKLRYQRTEKRPPSPLQVTVIACSYTLNRRKRVHVFANNIVISDWFCFKKSYDKRIQHPLSYNINIYQTRSRNVMKLADY